MKTNRVRHLLLTYFTFTRAEKHAALFLTGLLFVMQTVLWVRYYVAVPAVQLPEESPEELLHRSVSDKEQPVVKAIQENSPVAVANLFPFNPDTAGISTLVKLGLSPKQAASMIRFKEKTGGFKNIEEMSKVRVLRTELLEKWKPWLRFSQATTGMPPVKNNPLSVKQINKLTDINHADTSQLMDLPFIGAGRARAIVNYRDRLGGFVKKDQLLDLKIIPDSVYQIIQSRISCDGLVFRRLDINHTPTDSLRHPYLPKPVARIIVSYREQHGSLYQPERS